MTPPIDDPTRVPSQPAGPGGDAPPPAAAAEKERRGPDRRQSHPVHDDNGAIKSTGYSGPDRRTGLDRRAYMERQRQLIREEQSRFVQRTMLTFAFFFIIIVVAGVFLLAPEYAWLKYRHDHPPETVVKAAPAPAPQVGQIVNKQIKRLEDAGVDISATTQSMINGAGAAAGAAAETARQLAAGDATGLRELVDFIGRARGMTATPEGRAQLDSSIDRLKSVLSGWQGDAAGFTQGIAAARAQDPALDTMLSNVAAPDVGAAAMLLLMGEFRSNLESGRPFEQDLAVARRLAGNDPALQKSLTQLAPYAKAGVLNTGTLQREFKGLAMDIVTAKASGEDANLQQRASARLQGLVKMRNVETVDGVAADAVVNRAQRMLDAGDVAGAVRELQTLQGAQAQVAAPFINQAQGSLAAGQSADMLISKVLGQLAAGGGVSVEGLKGLIDNSLGFNRPVSPVTGR